MCLIADNTSVNHKIARLYQKQVIGCMSHRLNLQVNAMIEQHQDLSNILDQVHETMISAKQLKSAAVLRKLTEYKPILHNRTRWSSKSETLSVTHFLSVEPIVIFLWKLY